MSNFEREWPVTTDINEHQRTFQLAIKEINGHLELPSDGRMDIAYANHMQGGPSSFTVVRGEASVGKTDWHNMVFGEQRRVAIQPEDTEASLFGHKGFGTPTDGKVKASESDPNVYFNEVSQLLNPSALGVFGDGGILTTVNGDIPLEYASTGATDNLYRKGQKRVQKRDSAMDSRWRSYFLLGGIGMDVAQRIHTMVAEKANSPSSISEKPNGLIPNLAAKYSIRQAIVESMPWDPKQVGEYMPILLERVLLDPLVTSDSLQKEAARVTEGSITAARSLKFAEGSAATFETLGIDRLSQVAAITVAGVVRLSQVGSESFDEALGGIDGLGAFDSEVALRRLISAHAQKLAWDYNTTGNLTEDKLRLHMNRYSFASTGDSDRDGQIDDFIIKSLYDRKEGLKTDGKRKRFGRRTR